MTSKFPHQKGDRLSKHSETWENSEYLQWKHHITLNKVSVINNIVNVWNIILVWEFSTICSTGAEGDSHLRVSQDGYPKRLFK